MEDVALIQEILANPGDDLPRLIYADWLEDHGTPQEQARAEFIRIQIELANMDRIDERRPILEARERRLRKKNERHWLGPLRDHVHGWAFERGFLEHLALDAVHLLRQEELIRTTQPVRSIRLTGTREPRVMSLLGKLPFLQQLTSLDLSNNYLDRVEVEPLLASPHLCNLLSLRFNDNPYGYDAVQAIVGSPELTRLTTLELRRNNLTDGTVMLLAHSPYLTQLSYLDLRGNAINELGRSQLRSYFREGVRF